MGCGIDIKYCHWEYGYGIDSLLVSEHLSSSLSKVIINCPLIIAPALLLEPVSLLLRDNINGE